MGIGYKGHKYLQELPGCRNDVVSMFKLLTGPLFGFEQSTVHILSDEVDRIGNVSVVAPTRINILQHMKWLTKDIVSGDSVVFFFAGHGEAVEDVSGDEIETGFDQVCKINKFKTHMVKTNRAEKMFLLLFLS